MPDFAAARRMMVDGQVRTQDVTDHRIIAAMGEVARESFVPAEHSEIAYLDLDLPLGGSRYLLKPMVLAKLIQVAAPAGDERVLDVGCGTGYSSAVLSLVAGQVVALEEDQKLAAQARNNLATMPSVKVVTGPLAAGCAEHGPYDVILINGAVEVPPQALCRQLKDGGRLVCVQGRAPAGRAMLYRAAHGEVAGRPVFDAAAPLLPGFARTPSFAF